MPSPNKAFVRFSLLPKPLFNALSPSGSAFRQLSAFALSIAVLGGQVGMPLLAQAAKPQLEKATFSDVPLNRDPLHKLGGKPAQGVNLDQAIISMMSEKQAKAFRQRVALESRLLTDMMSRQEKTNQPETKIPTISASPVRGYIPSVRSLPPQAMPDLAILPSSVVPEVSGKEKKRLARQAKALQKQWQKQQKALARNKDHQKIANDKTETGKAENNLERAAKANATDLSGLKPIEEANPSKILTRLISDNQMPEQVSSLSLAQKSSQVKESSYAMLAAENSSKMAAPVKKSQAVKPKIAAANQAILPPLEGGYPAFGGNSTVIKSGVSSVGGASASASANEVDVTINKAVILNLSKPAARVSISNPEIASALVITPTQIQLIGNQVGVANLLIWSDPNAPEHTVIDVQVHRDVSVLSRQLKFVDPGIQVVPLAAEDTVILTGEAKSREAAQVAVDLAKAFFQNGGSGAASGGASGAGGNSSRTSSASPGSALPGVTPNIINLINIKGEPSTKLSMARGMLQKIDPNIKIDIVPGSDGSEKAILSGRVKTSSMISKAINTASVFYGLPGIKLITGPGGNSVRSAPGSSAFPGNEAFSDNIDINILQGSVMTDTSGNVISMLEVAFKPQIKCSIQFVEVSKNGLDALGHAIFGIGNRYAVSSLSGAQSGPSGRPVSGLDQDQSGATWSSSYNPVSGGRSNSLVSGFSQAISSGATQVFQINGAFTAAISALEERRKARTLAEPTLTLLSGEKASFLAGGEVPIPVIGGNGQVDVTYHEFGIRLNLVATYLDTGKIHMLVAPEISSIDPANGVSSSNVTVPGFRTRRMQSTLELEQGQSFILAGLYNQEEIWSVSRLPWFGNLPILGALGRNKWKSNNRTELIVVIKPEVVMLDAGTGQEVSAELPASFNSAGDASANRKATPDEAQPGHTRETAAVFSIEPLSSPKPSH
ncbi:MAG: pilus assembly protein N-terminal domain-containing protein [Vampirovibrionales bacterium]|nr:pilus assembly protein N-terminal domain-containing protein [Vampirovibrionales bacterium]